MHRAPESSQWAVSRKLQELRAQYRGPDPIPQPGTTTLMVRNIPRSYTAEEVVIDLQAVSPGSNYNFVYLLWDSRRNANLSFAFVNFADDESAMMAFFSLSGQMWKRNQKPCRVATAHVQGLAENLGKYIAESGNQEEGHPHPPLVFHNGRRMELTDAVRTFCTAEMHHRAKQQQQVSRGSPNTRSVAGSQQSAAPNSGQSMAAESHASSVPHGEDYKMAWEQLLKMTLPENAEEFRDAVRKLRHMERQDEQWLKRILFREMLCMQQETEAPLDTTWRSRSDVPSSSTDVFQPVAPASFSTAQPLPTRGEQWRSARYFPVAAGLQPGPDTGRFREDVFLPKSSTGPCESWNRQYRVDRDGREEEFDGDQFAVRAEAEAGLSQALRGRRLPHEQQQWHAHQLGPGLPAHPQGYNYASTSSYGKEDTQQFPFSELGRDHVYLAL